MMTARPRPIGTVIDGDDQGVHDRAEQELVLHLRREVLEADPRELGEPVPRGEGEHEAGDERQQHEHGHADDLRADEDVAPAPIAPPPGGLPSEPARRGGAGGAGDATGVAVASPVMTVISPLTCPSWRRPGRRPRRGCPARRTCPRRASRNRSLMSVESAGTDRLGGVVREADVAHVEERLRVGRVAVLEHDLVGALDRRDRVAAALQAEHLALGREELGPERERGILRLGLAVDRQVRGGDAGRRSLAVGRGPARRCRSCPARRRSRRCRSCSGPARRSPPCGSRTRCRRRRPRAVVSATTNVPSWK